MREPENPGRKRKQGERKSWRSRCHCLVLLPVSLITAGSDECTALASPDTSTIELQKVFILPGYFVMYRCWHRRGRLSYRTVTAWILRQRRVPPGPIPQLHGPFTPSSSSRFRVRRRAASEDRLVCFLCLGVSHGRGYRAYCEQKRGCAVNASAPFEPAGLCCVLQLCL